MRTVDALRTAREVIEVNLKAHNTPVKADVQQLVESYPLQHAITVLENLEKIFEGTEYP